jgi:toxoflavin synthase
MTTGNNAYFIFSSLDRDPGTLQNIMDWHPDDASIKFTWTTGGGAMPEYDIFADAYIQRTEDGKSYAAIELFSFFKALGSVRGLSILDLAAGNGRISRMLMEFGAASVVGGDVSPEMVRRAKELNSPPGDDGGGAFWPDLHYMVLDGRDRAFRLDRPVDVVTAMYLFPYAESEEELEDMGRLIARNLKPGGRFVAYTASPDYDFSQIEPRLMEYCGFEYEVVDGPRCKLVIAGDSVNIWQWSRDAYETRLQNAGLTDIAWHALQAPPNAPEISETMAFYLADPSCIVLSGRMPA